MSRRTIAIKAHGAGHLRRHDSEAEPWNRGKRQYVEPLAFEKIISSCVELSQDYRIVLIPGGTASHMYTRLARDLGLGEEIQKQVGCLCVEAIATIYAAGIANRLPFGTTRLVEVGTDAHGNGDTRVLVVKPSLRVMSTDSLAIAAAMQFGASALFFLKNGIPVLYGGLKTPTRFESVSLDDLRKLGEGKSGSPGEHYILDREALRDLGLCGFPSYLLNPDNLGDIASVMKGGWSDGMTSIIVD